MVGLKSYGKWLVQDLSISLEEPVDAVEWALEKHIGEALPIIMEEFSGNFEGQAEARRMKAETYDSMAYSWSPDPFPDVSAIQDTVSRLLGWTNLLQDNVAGSDAERRRVFARYKQKLLKPCVCSLCCKRGIVPGVLCQRRPMNKLCSLLRDSICLSFFNSSDLLIDITRSIQDNFSRNLRTFRSM